MKANMHPCSHSVSLESLTLTFGKPLLGSDGFEIQNAVAFPFFFFFPQREEATRSVCLRDRHR